MTPSHDGYACRQILGRDLVKGLGEEVDLRGFSALLGVLEARGCGVLAIKPLSAKLSIVGSLMAILLCVSTALFSSSLQV